MFNCVIVPLDGSMLGELALQPALRLARQSRGTVVLVRVPVYPEPAGSESTDYDSGWQADYGVEADHEAADYLREMREHLSQKGVSIRTMVVEGERARAIMDSSIACQADLVVMATHARSGVSRWLFDNVSGKIVRQSHCPVLLLRRPTNFQHITVVLDSSSGARNVIDPALALAGAFGSRITFLINAMESEYGRANGAKHLGQTANTRSYLETAIDPLRTQGLRTEIVEVSGRNHKSILGHAAENRSDMIAMSSYRRSALGKLIYGSEAERIMRDSGCAMLITRQPDHRQM